MRHGARRIKPLLIAIEGEGVFKAQQKLRIFLLSVIYMGKFAVNI